MGIWKLKYEDFWFVVKCYRDYMNVFFDDEEHEGMTPVCLEEFYDNEFNKFKQDYLDYLWEDFNYVDVEENGKTIMEDFYIWKKGTEIKTIMKWFSERAEKGVIYVYKGRK